MKKTVDDFLQSVVPNDQTPDETSLASSKRLISKVKKLAEKEREEEMKMDFPANEPPALQSNIIDIENNNSTDGLWSEVLNEINNKGLKFDPRKVRIEISELDDSKTFPLQQPKASATSEHDSLCIDQLSYEDELASEDLESVLSDVKERDIIIPKMSNPIPNNNDSKPHTPNNHGNHLRNLFSKISSKLLPRLRRSPRPVKNSTFNIYDTNKNKTTKTINTTYPLISPSNKPRNYASVNAIDIPKTNDFIHQYQLSDNSAVQFTENSGDGKAHLLNPLTLRDILIDDMQATIRVNSKGKISSEIKTLTHFLNDDSTYDYEPQIPVIMGIDPELAACEADSLSKLLPITTQLTKIKTNGCIIEESRKSINNDHLFSTQSNPNKHQSFRFPDNNYGITTEDLNQKTDEDISKGHNEGGEYSSIVKMFPHN